MEDVFAEPGTVKSLVWRGSHANAGWRYLDAVARAHEAVDGTRVTIINARDITARREMEAEDGRIVLKVNSLADPEIIDALYAASQAGVEIDLVVRGICCLRPGVPGLSDRIRVRSIVGRFLEHSRIFRFGSVARGPRYFIGSADLMARNLDSRVEAVVEVDEAAHQRRLDEILEVNLADDRLAWQLGPEGGWTRVASRHGLETHERLLESIAQIKWQA